jgi:hypothetical protein
METHYSQDDFDQVSHLLGRKPRGLYQVEKYHTKEKHPMVIKVLPWVEKAPFPTTYWLTCPILKKELSHLEKDRMIRQLESDYLRTNIELLNNLRKDHQDYRDERISFFNQTISDWDRLPLAHQEIIKTTGIGGIADFDHIKCLHLQYAYHLVKPGGTTIGRLVDELKPHIKNLY